MSYYVIVHAKPGTLLRGGVRFVKSSRFKTKKGANDYIYGMQQPNFGSAKIVSSKRHFEIDL